MGLMNVSSVKYKWRFDTRDGRKAEAGLNLLETQDMLAKRVPAHLRDEEPEAATPVGQCVRNVSRILHGKKRR